MSRLPLTLACWDYDRTRAIQDGRVRPEGIDLTYLSLPVEETFYRQLRHREFDVSELSLSGTSPFTSTREAASPSRPTWPASGSARRSTR